MISSNETGFDMLFNTFVTMACSASGPAGYIDPFSGLVCPKQLLRGESPQSFPLKFHKREQIKARSSKLEHNKYDDYFMFSEVLHGFTTYVTHLDMTKKRLTPA